MRNHLTGPLPNSQVVLYMSSSEESFVLDACTISAPVLGCSETLPACAGLCRYMSVGLSAVIVRHAQSSLRPYMVVVVTDLFGFPSVCSTTHHQWS